MGNNIKSNKNRNTNCNSKGNRNSIDNQLKVTPIDDLLKYSRGELVEFPPFAENQPFVARLKRPSMMVLMKTGKIPNSLLSTANALFSGTSNVEEDENFYKEILEVIEVVAEAAFLEPTWREIKDAGIELTDDQMTFLFNYTQKGVKALEPFRR